MSNTRGFVETPVHFGRQGNLIGDLCVPTQPPGLHRRPLMLFVNSGVIHRVGPNRIYVKLARALASSGFASLRFDCSGVGDSLMPTRAREASIQDRVSTDIDDAMEFALQRHGAQRFVLIGLCSGADNALRTLGRRDDVVGSVLLDLNTHLTTGFWLRHHARRLRGPKSWSNLLKRVARHLRSLPRATGDSSGMDGARSSRGDAPTLELDAWVPKDLMRKCFQNGVARGAEILCIFTAGLPEQYNYREQLLDVLPGVDFRDKLELEYFDDSDHTFSRLLLQERLLDRVTTWAVRHFE